MVWARVVQARAMRSAWLALLMLACGGAAAPVEEPPIDPADLEDDGASIAGIDLPNLPVDVELDDGVLGEGVLRATDALSMPTPRPPVGEAWEVEAWADEELTAWLGRRAEAAAQAQRALEGARAADLSHSVIASAILGLVYSRFALDLRGIPVPEIFARSPERTRAFREALVTAGAPLWRRALDAFGSCANAAGAAPAYSLAAWRSFCDDEIREIEAIVPRDGEDGEDDEDDASSQDPARGRAGRRAASDQR